MDIFFAVGRCSLGDILVAQSERGICAISLGDNPQRLVEELQDTYPQARLAGDDAQFAHRVALVVGFVETPALGLDLPLDIRGTAFQQRVWQVLRQIPVGSTLSYAEVAKRIGSPKAVRVSSWWTWSGRHWTWPLPAWRSPGTTWRWRWM